MAWTSKDFVNELKDVEKLLSYNPAPMLQESLIGALLKKVDLTAELMPSDFVVMMEAVENSALIDEKKKTLKDELMRRAALNQQSSVGNAVVKRPQSLVNIAAYLTKKDLEQLMSGDITLAPYIIVQRLRLVGMTSMKEDTKRAAVSLLAQSMLWHGMQMPDADYTYRMATQLTSLFQSSKIQSPVPPMRTYPESPAELGEQWMKKVYGDEEPCLKTLPQLAEIGSQVAVRNTHGNLSRNASCRMNGKQQGRSVMLIPRQDILMNEACPRGPSSSRPVTLTIFDKQPSPQKPGTAGSNALDLLQLKKQMGRPSSPANKDQLALPAPETDKDGLGASKPENCEKNKGALPQASVSTPADQDQPRSLESYEDAAMASLLKRPASKSPVLKKPSASTTLEGSSGSAKPNTAIPAKRIYGCLRCRGNPNGCDTCHSDKFNGKRFTGRDDYNKFVQRQAAAGKVYK